MSNKKLVFNPLQLNSAELLKQGGKPLLIIPFLGAWGCGFDLQ